MIVIGIAVIFAASGGESDSVTYDTTPVYNEVIPTYPEGTDLNAGGDTSGTDGGSTGGDTGGTDGGSTGGSTGGDTGGSTGGSTGGEGTGGDGGSITDPPVTLDLKTGKSCSWIALTEAVACVRKELTIGDSKARTLCWGQLERGFVPRYEKNDPRFDTADLDKFYGITDISSEFASVPTQMDGGHQPVSYTHLTLPTICSV